MTLVVILVLCALGIDLLAMPPCESGPAMNYVREIIGLIFVLIIAGLIRLSDWLSTRCHRKPRARAARGCRRA